jgi:dihydrolipoamide dehydrogenase
VKRLEETMREMQVDVAIIGAGTAGMRAYREVSKKTDRVVLIEAAHYGTTCARVGCMPSKLLIAAAEAAHMIEKAPRFGVYPGGETKVDGREVMQRVRSERDRFVGFVVEDVEEWPEEQRVMGYARYLDDNTIQVDDHTLIRCKASVIATGGSPWIPPNFQPIAKRVIVNDDIFSWDDLPGAVAVFGAGVIGLELGQALHRLGVTTHIFGRGGSVGPLTDPVVRDAYRDALSEEFFLDADADIQSMQLVNEESAVAITFKDSEGQQHEITVDYVVAATGRRPNLSKLDLAKTSVKLDDRGIPVFDPFSLQCVGTPIFIAGDVNNQVPLLHEAADDGSFAGKNAVGYPDDVRDYSRRSPLSVVFSDPQVAMVGSTFKSLNPDCYSIGEVSFHNQGRSRVMLVNKGKLRVYGERGTGRFLGAEMAGPSAEHLGHLLAWCHQKKMTVSEMLDMPFYHPVIEEGLRTALRNLNHELHKAPEPVPHCLDCGPGA